MSGFDYIPKPDHGAAWITGASAGIGRALALRLAHDGWTVHATARGEEALAKLAEEHPSIRPAPADVTDAAAMRAVVARIREEHGALALAVLNAGVYLPMRAQDFSAEDAAKTFAVNLTGVANGVDPVLKALFDQGRGCLALTASVAGYRGLPRAAAYSATKAALIAMAESLAFDMAPKGLRISVVNPGFVETEATSVNAFEMPFLMTPEQAAARIADGLGRAGFEIAFPTRFVLILKALGLLRPRSYFWAVRKAIGWDKVED